MVRSLNVVIPILVFVAISVGFAGDNKKAKPKQEEFHATCPVMGEDANEQLFIKFKGKKLYFCCDSCMPMFFPDEKAERAKAHYQLLQTKQITPVACPFSGHELDPKQSVKLGTVKVTFCCENCTAKAKKMDEDELKEVVFADLKKGFSLQTKCPVSGKAISTKHSIEHKKQKVYFCCPKCPKPFKDAPDKFLKKLPQFEKKKD